jgi:hypothetical protein
MADTEYTRELTDEQIDAAAEQWAASITGAHFGDGRPVTWVKFDQVRLRLFARTVAALPAASLGEEHPAEEALRALACWLGVGGYNAPSVDAEAFKRKIMEAVNMLSEGVPDALRYRWLRVQGAAFAGDPKRRLEDGLVYRLDNLDEAIDREMRLAASPASKSAGGGGEREAAQEVCRFPECRCPMDPGPEPDWCARGLPHARGPLGTSPDQQKGGA